MDRSGWTRVAFADVVTKVSDRVDPADSGLERYVAGEHMDTDDLRIRRWGEIGNDYLGPAFHMRFRPGQVLYGSRRTYLRKVAVPDFEGITANTTFVLEPKDPDVLLPDFLPYVMQAESFHEHSIKQSKGSVNPYVNYSDLEWYEFALPPPEEQRRLADFLRTAMDAQEAVIELGVGARRAIASAGRHEFEALASVDTTVRLIEICLRKPQNGIYKPEEFRGAGIPMIGMGSLFRDEVISDLSVAELIDLSADELERFALTSSDLLFGRRSVVLEGAGKCVKVGELSEATVFESSVLRVTIDRDLADPNYVFEWFNSPPGRQQVRRIVTFTTVSGVAGRDVARLPVPLPSLGRQLAIADRMSKIRERAGGLSARVTASRRLSRAAIDKVLA